MQLAGGDPSSFSWPLPTSGRVPRGSPAAAPPVPWVQVYKVPDFVWFSHKKHDKKDGITCETCHGPVAEREVIYKEKPATMASCMECHDQMGASVACNACHNP